MTTQTKFTVVLVNYKTLKMTQACLQLLQSAIAPYHAEIIVVDNDSADDSLAYLKKCDGIQLIERKPTPGESVYEAHGCALDAALARIESDYIFIMHTDTMVYDGHLFEMMLNYCLSNPRMTAVGCVDQVNRGIARSNWRLLMRFLKHYSRKVKLALGRKTRSPKPYREHHLRSFCTLWNAKILKEHGLVFSLDGIEPGYVAQDKLVTLGYTVKQLPAATMFRYLDHLQGGTKAFGVGSTTNHRLHKHLQFMEQLSL